MCTLSGDLRFWILYLLAGKSKITDQQFSMKSGLFFLCNVNTEFKVLYSGVQCTWMLLSPLPIVRAATSSVYSIGDGTHNILIWLLCTFDACILSMCRV